MKTSYQTLLSLDCLCGYFLTLYERHVITKLNNNHSNAPEPTLRILMVLELIEHFKWKPPKFKIDDSKLVNYYDDNGNKQPIENYKHPIINEVKKLI